MLRRYRTAFERWSSGMSAKLSSRKIQTQPKVDSGKIQSPGLASDLLEHSNRRHQLASANRGIESCRERRKCRCGPPPLQLIHRLEYRNIGPQGRQSAKQKRSIPFVPQRARELRGIRNLDLPLVPVLRNRLDAAEACKDRGR